MGKHEVNSASFRTSIGGQALIEGILMRGPEKQAIVCRRSDGTLVTKVEELTLIKAKHPWMGLPLIRGVVNFLDSMIHGVRALTWSAEQQPDDARGEPDKLDEWISRHFSGETAEKLIVYVAVALGIALSVGIFALLPTFLAGLSYPSGRLSGVSSPGERHAGHEARVDVPRGRTQDHFLL